MAHPQAKFTTGSTMRHVVVMTMTGALGLSFMFLVDFLTLFWVSRLHQEVLISAVGFAATIQFFVVSVAIGMMIAGVALVSRSLGMGKGARARRIASVVLIYATGMQTLLALLVFFFRRDILVWSGAEGETLEVAVQFLSISLPSLPFIAMGMCASAVLRAVGDAWRSMLVTMTGGAVAVFLDPLFILFLGLGVDGAAMVIVLSRLTMAVIGLYWLGVSHKMLAKPRQWDMVAFLKPYLAIALPAVATQLSTPFGNWILIRAMAEHGDSAVAGFGVVSRLTILGFGGIFALSGAIGGIIGQNAGAGLRDRVAQSYVDALKFCAIYTGVTWALMAAFADTIAAGFGLSPEGAHIVRLFSHYAAGSFVFTGALFVSNSAFNNLGRPVWATVSNWLRDGILMAPLAFGMGLIWGAGGVVMAQALANTLIGIGAALIGWRYVRAGRGIVTRERAKA
ncbi:MATE family efflux transporter [Thalassovita mangrovi]|uniref:Multidrug transporter MATE n=1 Tax=Thalassovita mangrovi TaxID=2692236 RepID=A0A6L8LG43_9RHOB|nr:MATE family efflux transporter [Thalassovita mangrovi]MYM54898.1 multidrug transporter MATE [Thalassovita mangrovi]